MTLLHEEMAFGRLKVTGFRLQVSEIEREQCGKPCANEDVQPLWKSY